MKRLSTVRLSGASLIEVLIATLVVGLVLTSIAFLMSLNVKSSVEAELRAQATIFAQQGVDVVRNHRAGSIWSAFVGTNMTTLGCTNNALSFANTTFRRTCALQLQSGSGACASNQNICRLTITVCWPMPAASCTNNVVIIQDFYNR